MLLLLLFQHIFSQSYIIDPELFFRPDQSFATLKLHLHNSTLAHPSSITTSSFNQYINLTQSTSPQVSSAFQVVGVYPTDQQVLVFLTIVNPANFYDSYTIEIKDIDEWRDSYQNPPSVIRFTFHLDGAFVAGSRNNIKNRVVNGSPSILFSNVILENLAIACSLAMLYVCFYTTIQNRQLVYPLMYVISFMQVLYWLSFYDRKPGDGLPFLIGFRIILIKFFPNFILFALPTGYVGPVLNEKFSLLTIDNLFLRTAGEVLCLWGFMLLVVLFYYIINYFNFNLVKDFKEKMYSALMMLLMFSWGNAFFFSFANFYTQFRTTQNILSFTMSNYIISIIIFILMLVTPFLILLTKVYNNFAYTYYYLFQLFQYLKKILYAIIIITTSGYANATLPAVEFVLLFVIVYFAKEKLFAAIFQVLAVIAYILAVALDTYGAALVIVATFAICFAIFHQLYYIWGEKFFDLYDEREQKEVIKEVKMIEIKRVSEEELQSDNPQGFEKVGLD